MSEAPGQTIFRRGVLGLNGGPVVGFIGSFYHYEGLRFLLGAVPALRAQVPLKRVGQPEDNADVVLFLASPLSRFVTGHVIPTDGGTLVAGGWFRTVRGGRWTNRPRNP